MSNQKILGLIGSFILFIGVFMPIVSVPVVGNLNFYMNGEGDGVWIIGLAAISFVLVLKGNYKGLWFPALASLALMAYTFFRFQDGMAQAREEMRANLEGNPFGGLAEMFSQSIQMQWGWVVLLAGAGLLIASAMQKTETPTARTPEKHDQ